MGLGLGSSCAERSEENLIPKLSQSRIIGSVIMRGFGILRLIFPVLCFGLAQIHAETILTVWSDLIAQELRFTNR